MDIIHYSGLSCVSLRILLKSHHKEPLVKDARAHDVELPGQVVKVVALIGISLV